MVNFKTVSLKLWNLFLSFHHHTIVVAHTMKTVYTITYRYIGTDTKFHIKYFLLYYHLYLVIRINKMLFLVLNAAIASKQKVALISFESCGLDIILFVSKYKYIIIKKAISPECPSRLAPCPYQTRHHNYIKISSSHL